MVEGPSGQDALIWKALADPTRRELLDLLNAAPTTTGELARAFPTTRYAVMKHLSVLVDADLVVVRRRGRERWNHLNAVPLRRVYERWVSKWEDRWAGGLPGLQRHVEKQSRSTERMEDGAMGKGDAASVEEMGVVRLELEVAISAPRARVWEALVNETTHWWRRDFYVGSDARGFFMEPRVGGRVFEDWGEEAGVLWFTVIGLDAERSLDLSGQLTAAFGGPATTLVRIELADAEGGTVLKLSDSIFGRVGPNTAGTLKEGWGLLFGEGLRTYVERADMPAKSKH